METNQLMAVWDPPDPSQRVNPLACLVNHSRVSFAAVLDGHAGIVGLEIHFQLSDSLAF